MCAGGGTDGHVLSGELDYLTSERRLGRLATAGADGHFHVVPVGMWRANSDLGTIDTRATTSRANVSSATSAPIHERTSGRDLASADPWRPRAVMVAGPAQAIDASPQTRGEGIMKWTDPLRQGRTDPAPRQRSRPRLADPDRRSVRRPRRPFSAISVSTCRSNGIRSVMLFAFDAGHCRPQNHLLSFD